MSFVWRLAQQGLPKGGAVGFELLDQEKFGISQFSEQVNYQRALEGELARTIETLGPVKSAPRAPGDAETVTVRA
ncbi:flagellar M-ring protein FliF [Enterobacter cancerogenus]|uniref:Flagellar M-ring protein FliF n=1 Tax=Enterobacter cancerogenus TaxID=69218 RepID=A0A484YFH1_9ENTR|nr:flagellar M-ring protein FliF [Enterobacter cancerogenus]